MRIYREGKKIYVELSGTDVLFNNGDIEESTIWFDGSLKNVKLIVNAGSTIISGLSTDEYKELFNTMMQKVKEMQGRRKPVTKVSMLTWNGNGLEKEGINDDC